MPTAEMEQVRERPKQVKLHPKHRLFVEYYLRSANATQAAISAGYSEASAFMYGSQLLRVPKIREAIEYRLYKHEIKSEKVLQEIGHMAFSNMADYLKIAEDGLPQIDFTDTTRAQWAALQEYKEDATGGDGDGERKRVVRRTIKLQSKPHALEMLAKHLHLLDTRIEIDVSDGLAGRLGGARHRTLEASPEGAQLLIDKHSEQLVTTQSPTYDDSFDGAEGDGPSLAEDSTSLPPTPRPPFGVPPILPENLAKVEDAGISESAGDGVDIPEGSDY